jgi:hypothetical protein
MNATEQYERQACIQLNDVRRNKGHADVDRTGSEARVRVY